MLPGRGRSPDSSATSSAGPCPVNRPRMSSGPVMISARAWLIVWVRCARAVRLATIRARIASTCPSRPRGAPGRTAGLRGAGGADRVQRIGLARPAPVLPVRAVHLDDPDPGRGYVPRQPGAVTAGALDADQAHGAEPAQPGQQPGI